MKNGNLAKGLGFLSGIVSIVIGIIVFTSGDYSGIALLVSGLYILSLTWWILMLETRIEDLEMKQQAPQENENPESQDSVSIQASDESVSDLPVSDDDLTDEELEAALKAEEELKRQSKNQ